MTTPNDAPVRLTEEERRFMEERANTAAAWPVESGAAVVDAMAYMRRLLDHIAAQARELAEARELIRKEFDWHSSVLPECNCTWCHEIRAWLGTWLAATAQETEGSEG